MAGTWNDLTTQPTFSPSTMLLLTDGTVMVQADNSRAGSLLTPDSQGSYRDGSWTLLPIAKDARRYYASAVLADGRVFVSGGEQSSTQTAGDITTTEIFDPALRTWS